jgi:hypothetical protein
VRVYFCHAVYVQSHHKIESLPQHLHHCVEIAQQWHAIALFGQLLVLLHHVNAQEQTDCVKRRLHSSFHIFLQNVFVLCRVKSKTDKVFNQTYEHELKSLCKHSQKELLADFVASQEEIIQKQAFIARVVEQGELLAPKDALH